MSKSKEIKGLVNAKSNKADIKDAYHQAIKVIQELEAGQFNPKEESIKIKNEETVSKAEKELNQAVTNRQGIQYLNTAINSIESIIKELKVNYEESKEGIEKSQLEYKEINEAIEIQKQKLKDFFGVEDVFVKLSNLITYYDDKEVELKDSYNTRVIDMEYELTTAKAKLKKDLEDLKLEFDRKRKEFEYDFARDKKIRNDETDDFFENKKKEMLLHEQQVNKSLSDRQDELAKSKEEFFKEKRTIENYEAEIESLKESRETDIELAKDQAKAKAKKSFDYEVRYIKKDMDTKLEIANNNMHTANEIIQDQKETISDLKRKLEAAYAEIKDLANKSMETSANKATIASLENMLKNQSKNSDK